MKEPSSERRSPKESGLGAPLSPIVEDYLKAILTIGQGEPVGTSALAQALNVAPASATAMTKRLADFRLVKRLPYRGVTLTTSGKRVALEILRHHRLIELFLHQSLGIPWDRVHDEAERWEHVISEEAEARIDELLDFPTHDPHGAPIPSASLEFEEAERRPLSALAEGEGGTVAEVSDDDPALLRYVGEMGLYPGTRFEVESGPRFDGGSIALRLPDRAGDAAVCTVDGRAAASIFVQPG